MARKIPTPVSPTPTNIPSRVTTPSNTSIASSLLIGAVGGGSSVSLSIMDVENVILIEKLQAESEIQKLRIENMELKMELKDRDHQSILTQMESMKKEYADLFVDARSLQDENSSLKEEIQRIEEENEQLKSEFKKLADENWSLKQDQRLESSFVPFDSLMMLEVNQAEWKKVKEERLAMSVEEKRAFYKAKDSYVTLKDIPTWTEFSKNQKITSQATRFPVNTSLNDKVSLFRGDITKLEIDAIVNAANKRLAGGGGADGAIHSAAGADLLQEECRTLGGCETGDAKITGGYNLPARYVIHTVGPVGEKPGLLESCYKRSLEVAIDNGVRTIAFPCVSTGLHDYPNENAARVALKAVRAFLDTKGDKFDQVIFCTFLDIDTDIYKKLLPFYFPLGSA